MYCVSDCCEVYNCSPRSPPHYLHDNMTRHQLDALMHNNPIIFYLNAVPMTSGIIVCATFLSRSEIIWHDITGLAFGRCMDVVQSAPVSALFAVWLTRSFCHEHHVSLARSKPCPLSVSRSSHQYRLVCSEVSRLHFARLHLNWPRNCQLQSCRK